jgi:hypothetical protein
MPIPTIVTETKSEPRPVDPRDEWGEHITGARDSCPDSSHSKRMHRGRASTRVTVETLWSNGGRSRTYVDHCRCDYCGFEWNQEWMTA